jgi:hypothetical protein
MAKSASLECLNALMRRGPAVRCFPHDPSPTLIGSCSHAHTPEAADTLTDTYTPNHISEVVDDWSIECKVRGDVRL